MVVDERVLGAVEIRDGGLEFALRARQNPARRVGKLVTAKDGDSFALDDLSEMLAVEMQNGFAELEDLLVVSSIR